MKITRRTLQSIIVVGIAFGLSDIFVLHDPLSGVMLIITVCLILLLLHLLTAQEEAAKKDIERFRAVLDDISLIAVMLDREGNVTYVNRHALQVLGREKEGIVGRNWFDNFLPAEAGERIKKTYGETVKSGLMPRRFSNEILTADGRQFEIDWHNALLKDPAGAVIGSMSIGEDITERARAEEVVREAKSKLEGIFNSSPGAIVVTDGAGIITECNPAALEMNRVRSREELIGRNAFDLIAPEDRAAAAANMAGTLTHGTVRNAHYTLIRNDGSTFQGELTSSVIRDVAGKTTGFIAITTDITERTRAEKALRESEEKYRSLIDNINLGVLLVSPRMEVLSLNRRLKDLLPQVDLSRKHQCYSILCTPPRDTPCSGCPVQKTFADGKTHELVKELAWQGRQQFLRMIASPLKDAAGNIIAAIEITEDITDRKMAEQELAHYQERLRVLTSQLALEDEKERQRIAANIHDYVGQALAFAKMKIRDLEEKASVKQKDAVHEVRNMIEQSIQYTRSLMLELSPSVLFDLGFEAAVEWLADRMQEQHKTACTVTSDDAYKDIDQEINVILFRAVRELLANVAKHAKARQVRVRLQRVEDRLEVCVSDDGVGFDETQSRKVTGFGLFSIREQLSCIGGTMSIDSHPGKGAAVVISAPLKGSAGRGLSGPEEGKNEAV